MEDRKKELFEEIIDINLGIIRVKNEEKSKIDKRLLEIEEKRNFLIKEKSLISNSISELENQNEKIGFLFRKKDIKEEDKKYDAYKYILDFRNLEFNRMKELLKMSAVCMDLNSRTDTFNDILVKNNYLLNEEALTDIMKLRLIIKSDLRTFNNNIIKYKTKLNSYISSDVLRREYQTINKFYKKRIKYAMFLINHIDKMNKNMYTYHKIHSTLVKYDDKKYEV